MKNSIIILVGVAFLYACSGNDSKPTADAPAAAPVAKKEEKKPSDDSKGVGKFTNVELSPTLDNAMVERAQKTYDLKCSACHRLTGEKLVGPGWAGVTSRRKVEWVMNFVTNTDEMLNKNPAAQAMLETCLVRMPNQNVSDGEARDIYEFMRKNDGVK